MSADPWNKLPTSDSWSDQVDKEEAKNGGQLDGGNFPSLSQASRTKGKKKSAQSMSLSQFMTQDTQTGGVLRTPGGVGRSQTDTEILMSLPNQPKQKDPNNELPQRWNTKRGTQERGRRPMTREEDFTPSRADESSHWGTDKRSTFTSSTKSRNYDRSHSQGYDDKDSWSSTRSGFGSFHRNDRRQQNGGGFGNHMNEDRWSQNYQATSERKPLTVDKRTKPLESGQGSEMMRSVHKSNPFGNARPREEVLKDRGLDVASSEVFSSRSELLSDQDVKSPTSSISGTEFAVDNSVSRRPKQRTKDPFGGARPREVVLDERGQQSNEEQGVKFNRQVEEIGHRIEAI